jgi:glycosyltransferase involved in cell wall biosynthesis
MNGAIALTWFEHRRIRELCAGLEFELVVMSTARRGLLRYLLLAARTVALLGRRRPSVLLVQNPSLVLTTLAVTARSVLGFRLIMDAHNEAVIPFVNRQRWISRLSQWLIRRADLTIVTNRQLAELVQRQGGRPFILPDRVPIPPPVSARSLGRGFNLVLIATFASDEPIAEVFEAVRGTDVVLYVTGNHHNLDKRAAVNVPPNVRFTGFLPEHDYWSLLQSADGIVDLTLVADCLVCGAYEALGLGKPMLLSNNSASVELFGDCAVFTDNSPLDIRRALGCLRRDRVRLQAAAAERRGQLRDAWVVRAKDLAGTVAGWVLTARPNNAKRPTS